MIRFLSEAQSHFLSKAVLLNVTQWFAMKALGALIFGRLGVEVKVDCKWPYLPSLNQEKQQIDRTTAQDF